MTLCVMLIQHEEYYVHKSRKNKNREKQKRYLENNPEARLLKKQYATYWRIRKKMELIQYKGGKCEICGYNKDVNGAYDFHHVDPTKKEFGISRWSRLNLSELKKEVDKCLLLCKNCHAEIHDNKKLREEALLLYRVCDAERTVKCECGKQFNTRDNEKKYCSPACAHKGSRIVERPTADELRGMIETMSWLAIGRKYGVSDNAVRKWARTYKLI